MKGRNKEAGGLKGYG